MTRPRALPSELRGGPFAVSRARELGVTPARLRASDLDAPFPGVRVAADSARDIVSVCRSYAARSGDTRPFTGVTAAQLWGIPLSHTRVDAQLHVLDVRGVRAPRGVGVRGHKTTREPELVELDGLVVTSAVDTWLSLSNVLDLDGLIVAGDRLVAWKTPLTTLTELRSSVERFSGMRGARRARAALEEIRPGSGSPRESRMRLAIVRAGLPEPALNAPIRVAGRELHGDLAYPAHRILLEYESTRHREDDWQWAHDLARYNALSEAGWIVIRVGKLMHPAEVVDATRRVLRQRGAI